MFKDKKIVSIVALVILLVIGVTSYGYITLVNAKETFPQDGFILGRNASEDDTGNVDENYYFSAGSKYQKKYPNKVVFQNNNDEKVIADETNFVHFKDDSLMSLSDGVFLNADQLQQKTLRYYNIGNRVVLEKQNNNYLIRSQKNEEKMKNFIWKISDTKYMLVSPSIEMHFTKEKEDTVEDYLEVEFVDKGVVRLAHQDGTYQTVSKDAYLELENGVQLRLKDKTLVAKEKDIMTLAQMVIDADDNIEVIEKDEVKESEDSNEDKKDDESSQAQGENGTAGDNGAVGGNGANGGVVTQTPSEENQGSTNQNQNDEDNSNSNQQQNQGEDGGDMGNTPSKPEMPEEDTTVEFPSFEMTNFETTLISVTGSVEITDNDGLLKNTTNVKIVESNRGKVVYDNDFAEGAMNFDFGYEGLKPDTEYVVTVSGDYEYKDEEYHKDFITKVFKTDDLGISFKKGYVTSSSIGIEIHAQAYTQVSDAKLALYKYNAAGDLEKMEDLDVNIADAISSGSYLDEFNSEIQSNTDYVVKLESIQFGSSLINLTQDNLELKIKTLKKSPILGLSAGSVDARSGSFSLYNKPVGSEENGEYVDGNSYVDVDNGITKVRYEIYNDADININPENGEDIFAAKPIKTIEMDRIQEVSVQVDGTILKKSNMYAYRQVVEFFDNEKTIEYTGNVVRGLTLADQPSFPIVKWTKGDQKHDALIGTIALDVEQGGESIQNIIAGNKVLIVVRSGTDRTRTLTWEVENGDFSTGHPINLKGLTANTYYHIEVFAQLKGMEASCEVGEICSNYVYIGGVTEKTAVAPPVTLRITIPEFKAQEAGVPFNFAVQLKGETSAENESMKEVVQTIRSIEMTLHKEDRLTDTVGSIILADRENNEAIEQANPDAYSYAANTMIEDFYDQSQIYDPTNIEGMLSTTEAKYYTLKISEPKDYCEDRKTGKEGNRIPLKVILENKNTGKEETIEKDPVDGTYHVRIDTHGFLPEYEEDVHKVDPEIITNGNVLAAPNEYPEFEYDQNLDSGTAVGIKVQAHFPSNAMRYVKSVTYTAWIKDSNGKFIPYANKKLVYDPDKDNDGLPKHVFKLANGTKEEMDGIRDAMSNETLHRGHGYYFTYSVEMNLTPNAENEVIVHFPQDRTEENKGSQDAYDEEKVLSTQTKQEASKQLPKIKMYVDHHDETNTNEYTFKYRYSDIDNTILDGNLIHNNNEEIGIWDIADGKNEGSFPLLMDNGQHEIQKKIQKLWEQPEGELVTLTMLDVDHISQDAYQGISFTFAPNNPVGRAILTLKGDEKLLKRITSVDMTFTEKENSSNTITFENVPLQFKNDPLEKYFVDFPITKLNQFKGKKEFKVDVQVHYDTGKMGIANCKGKDSDFVMGTYIPETNAFMYALGKDHMIDPNAGGKLHFNLTSDTEQEFYSSGTFLADHRSNIKMEGDDEITKYEYSYTTNSYGFKHGDVANESAATYLVPRTVETAEIQKNETVYSFDYVYPEVSNVKTTAGLIDAVIEFDYNGTNRSELLEEDGKRYVYLTLRKNGEIDSKTYKQEITSTEQKVTFEIPSDGNDELVHDSSYFYTIGVKFSDASDHTEIYTLIDSDTGNQETYHFSTIAEVELTNIQYAFINKSYKDKQIQFSYDPMSKVSEGSSHSVVKGFKVVYTLKDAKGNEIKDENGKPLSLEETKDFTTTTTTHFSVGIDSYLAKYLNFGESYILSMTPLLANGDPMSKDRSSYNCAFTLDYLQEPHVTLRATPTLENGEPGLGFAWTLSDMDNALVDGKYTVSIYKGTRSEINDSSLLYKAEKEFFVNEEGELVDHSGDISKEDIQAYFDKHKPNTTFAFEKDQPYTMVINGKYDQKYNGKPNEWSSSYTMNTPNENGISYGKVFVEKDNNDETLKLVFYDQFGLSKVKKVTYTIYHPDGKTTTKTIEGQDVVFTTSEDGIATLQLGSDAIKGNEFKSGRYSLVVSLEDENGNVLKQIKDLDFSIQSKNVLRRLFEFLGF